MKVLILDHFSHAALTIELPILHIMETDKTGLGDIRLRHFWLPHKDW